MPKVSTKSLRSLANKVQPSILTGALDESADYIDELEKEIERLESLIIRLQDVHEIEKARLRAEIGASKKEKSYSDGLDYKRD